MCPFGAGSGLLPLVLLPGNRKCAEPGLSSLRGPPRLPQPSCCTDDTNRAGRRLPRLQPWTQSEPDPALRSEAFPLLPREDFFPQMVLTAKALGAGFTGETAPVPHFVHHCRPRPPPPPPQEDKGIPPLEGRGTGGPMPSSVHLPLLSGDSPEIQVNVASVM